MVKAYNALPVKKLLIMMEKLTCGENGMGDAKYT